MSKLVTISLDTHTEYIFSQIQNGKKSQYIREAIAKAHIIQDLKAEISDLEFEVKNSLKKLRAFRLYKDNIEMGESHLDVQFILEKVGE